MKAITTRLEALEKEKIKRPYPPGALIVLQEGDEYTEADQAEMDRSRRAGIPPMIVVIGKK